MDMKSFVILLCAVGATLATSDAGDRFVEVQAPIGRIRGSIIKSRLGNDIYSFRGVRYAEPPVGERRFQLPVPAEDWNDVFDATQEGPGCPRVGSTPGNMSEDCLRVNVYTTKLPDHEAKQVKRPVIVFFHPGGFYISSGQSYAYGPQYLLDKDLVLVTLNYRMATLGFLSTADAHAPGNLAMKDQVVALKWVQRNIAAFGGDPNSVTIAGCSAGSLSVMLHMVSPMSKNLFHRGIAMSAGISKLLDTPTNQTHIAIKQAELLGCPTHSSEAIISCLKTKPIEDFVSTIPRFFEFANGFPVTIWSAVVEPEIEGLERFLPQNPTLSIRQGKINEVPFIASVTRDEFASVGLYFERELAKGNLALFKEVEDNWYTLSPINFIYERGTPRSFEISREVKKFYLNDEPFTPAKIDSLALAFADSITLFPAYRSMKLFAEHSKLPVYFEKFTYQGRYSYAMRNDSTPYGVVHQDDTQYLFYLSTVVPYVKPGDPENEMIDRMTAVWYNFAKTGEPIPKNDKNFEGVTWERYDACKDNYLNFNLPLKMETGFYPERMSFWERFFPLPPLPPTEHQHQHQHQHHHKH